MAMTELWCNNNLDDDRVRFQEGDDNHDESNMLAMKDLSWRANLEKPPWSEDRRGRALGLRSNFNLESDKS
jgi:hypothetical protein